MSGAGRRSRAVVALACLALLVGACGDDDGEAEADERQVTIAFLRAVGGVPSTEPAFVEELRVAGYRSGQNLTILAGDADEAHPDPEDAAAVAARWEADGVDIIVALSSTGARAAAEAAPNTDILFLSNDPTATGLVDDEKAPTGRLTGVTFRVPADRTLELASRAVPGTTRIGMAYPPDDPAAQTNLAAVEAAAEEVGLTLVTAEFDAPEAVGAAVRQLVAQDVDALLLSTSPAATRVLAETAAAAAAAGLPVIANTTLAESAVLSLAPDTEELGRQLGRQAARLLAGARPSAVPVEDPNHFIVTVNVRAAAALGITVPPALLREANAVIQ